MKITPASTSLPVPAGQLLPRAKACACGRVHTAAPAAGARATEHAVWFDCSCGSTLMARSDAQPAAAA